MPLTNTTFDSLPYIDRPPSPTSLAAANKLITSSLPSPLPSTHPSLPSTHLLDAPNARPEKLSSITTAHYEALDASELTPSTPLETLRSSLRAAAITSTYLRLRLSSLSRLSDTGKEDWLSSNAETAARLEGVEKELADTKEAIERVVGERRAAQGQVSGEMGVLENGWREGVARVLETEVAAEGVRREVLGRMRGE